MTDTHPLAGAIDRAICNALAGKTDPVPLTDSILAEIEAEWPGIRVERRLVGRECDGVTYTRIASDWRAES